MKKIDGSLFTITDKMDESKIAQIIAVLKQHEHDLSDGYQWYSGRRENKSKNVIETLREVAIAILTAIENPPAFVPPST